MSSSLRKLSHGGMIGPCASSNGSNGTNGSISNGNGHPKSTDLGKFGNLENPYNFEIISESAQYIKDRMNIKPEIAIICGSGLGSLADTITDKVEFPYEEIPHFPVSTVAGHAGKLVIGHLSNVPVICMQGRFHFYEGYPIWKCSMPVRVFKLLGIKLMIVTNAAGGLNPNYSIGDVMILKDHINLPGFSGINPLCGRNDERFGLRFPPLNKAYDKSLRTIAKEVAKELKIDHFFQEGVYTMVGGPTYETVAELRAMKLFGIDAVGMSTVPEVITASHCGIKCFGFSLITNVCITDFDAEEEASHEEVVETAHMRQNDLKEFVTRLVPHFEKQIQRS